MKRAKKSIAPAYRGTGGVNSVIPIELDIAISPSPTLRQGIEQKLPEHSSEFQYG